MKSLLKFEAYFFLRQPAFIIAIIVSLAIGYLLSGRVVTAGSVQFLSASNLTYFVAMFSLPAIFIITLLSANTLIRDKTYGFLELVCATPTRYAELHLSRFLGLFIASILLCLITFISYTLPVLLSSVGEDVFGTFRWANFLWPVAVILIPNVLITCAILFFISQFLQKTIWVYLTGLGIYVFYIFVTAYFDSPMFTASKPLEGAQLSIISVLEPFAINAYLEQVQFWSNLEKNSLRGKLEGTLLANRLFWIFLSCVLITLTLIKEPSNKKAKEKVNKNIGKVNKKNVNSLFVYGSANIDHKQKVYSSWLMFKHSFSIEFFSVFSSLSFALLILLTVVLVSGQLIASVEMNSAIGTLHPYTSLLAPIISVSLKIVSIITLAFYAAELAYRAKEAKFDQILMTTPISRWSLYLSQLLVLSTLIFCLLFAAIVTAVCYQLINGFYTIDWGLYVSLIPIYVMPMIFLSVLCMSIQFAVNNKYLGIILSVIAMLTFGTSVGTELGLEHVLLKFSSLATIRYSDFNGFDYYWTNILTMLFHWFSYSIVLIFVGYGLFNKPVGRTNLKAITGLPKTLSSQQSKILFASVFIAFCSTSFVYWNTNIINTYQNSQDQAQRRVNYESQFVQFRNKNAPFITDVKVDVKFFPREHTLQIDGEFSLENTRQTNIDEFIISMPSLDIAANIQIPTASSIEHLKEFNTYLVKLNSPLKPNERLSLNFTSEIARAGFKHQDFDVTLVANGSYFHSENLFPFIGFNPSLGVLDEARRQELGLPTYYKREDLVANKHYKDHLKVKDANLVDFEAVVSTSIDQIAIAPGDLLKQWTENNRRYFHYKVTRPTSNFFGFSSARYEKLESEQNGKKLTIYYHPGHNKNIKQMMKTAKLSLERFSEQYSPYQYQNLTFAEIPYQAFARAYPATIFFGENAGFKENLNNEANLDDFSSIVAHEVAHQWWGHQLKTANAQGATLLIESLAEYSSLTIMGEMYGEGYIQAELRRATTRYLSQRGQVTGVEPALYVMNDERFLRYEKGLIAFDAIAHKVGRPAFNKALRKLLIDKAFVEKNYATNLDFLSLFNGHKYQAFINDSLTKVVLYDLALGKVSVTKREGNYLVNFTVNMSETDYSKEKKGETHLSNQEVDYTVFVNGSQQGTRLVKGTAKVKEGKALVTVSLPQRPSKIVLDSYLHFTDRNFLDNRKTLLIDE